jgi:hypothetical protein
MVVEIGVVAEKRFEQSSDFVPWEVRTPAEGKVKR